MSGFLNKISFGLLGDDDEAEQSKILAVQKETLGELAQFNLKIEAEQSNIASKSKYIQRLRREGSGQ